MTNWKKDIADQLGTKHSDTEAVIRAGKKGAKKRTSRHNRQKQKTEIKDQS